ncbi:MAG TPA: class I SAM-dependent methyltransferase [Bacteroidia bacterium]|nr:class I SAM-dependent methyltransferase [Bacteroidia bacterium]
MEKLHNLDEKDFQDILKYKDLLLSNGKKLAQLDPNDYYWQDLSNETTLSRNGIFLESNMVESWVGATRKPKRILEIGTRSGGSLIALLCVYSKEDYDKVEEVLSFDMWREYVSTTPFATMLSKLMGKKRNINISERFTKWIGNYVEKKSTDKVRKNLTAFNIKTDKIKFISGDSTVKVPEYFAENPDKKFDYILVDGGHTVEIATKDLDNVVSHAAKGGIILFDDIMPESYNLQGVWNKFKEKNINDFDFFEIRHRKGIGFAIKK